MAGNAQRLTGSVQTDKKVASEQHDPPSVTTIAWRLWHLGGCPNPSWPPAARLVASRVRRQVVHTDSAVQRRRLWNLRGSNRLHFDRHWTSVADSVVGFADADLLNAVGVVGGRFGGGSIHGLVLHVADELIHHGAEIGVLRDLYAQVCGSEEPATASRRGSL